MHLSLITNTKFYYYFCLQSPAESLTTDSRPGSVLNDEGESNSEPPESMISLSKDIEEKDPLCIAQPETPSSDNLNKDEPADEMSPSNVATPDDVADIPAQSSKIAVDDDEEKVDKISVASPPEQQSSSQSSQSAEPVATNANNPINAAQPSFVKEQEMLSKLANMKQETTPSATAPTSAEFPAKEPIFIKKEPAEDSQEANSSCSEVHDLKLKVEVKSEAKTENQAPDQDTNNNAENLVCKPAEVKFSGPESADSPIARPDGVKYGAEGQVDYSMKTFIAERDGLKTEAVKRDGSPNVSSDIPDHLKYGPPTDPALKPNYPPDHPQGMLHPRHPFDAHNMMKYELPPPQPQDLKYEPREMKYGQEKSHFSADNLIGKGNYPPGANSEQPLDVSSRVTPNQDSQGSNSNSQPPNLPSPSTPTAPPPGMFGHLPANHPSLMSGNSSALPSITSGTPGSSHMPPAGSSPFLPLSSVQPTNLSSLHRPHQDIPPPGSRNYPGAGPPPTSTYGPSNPAFGASRLSEAQMGHRTSPLGLPGPPPHPLLSHPLPLHMGHPGMSMGHPAHLAHLAQHPHHMMQHALGKLSSQFAI